MKRSWVVAALTTGLICAMTVGVGAEQKNGAAAATKFAATSTPIGPPAVVAVDADYIIGQEDILSIEIWKEPELSRAVAVRSDGKISLPLLGEVQAAGLQPLQLKEELTNKLSAYLTSPLVTVNVQDARSQKISVLGEVSRPGTYPLIKPMTVLDALAAAGGFRDFAKTNKMFILRVAKDGKRTRIPLKYKKVISEKDVNDNIELQPRDTIIVP